jgi:hypothetical protein
MLLEYVVRAYCGVRVFQGQRQDMRPKQQTILITSRICVRLTRDDFTFLSHHRVGRLAALTLIFAALLYAVVFKSCSLCIPFCSHSL